MTDIRKLLRLAAPMMVLAAVIGGSRSASADVIFSDSHMIQGTGVISSVSYQFDVSSAGLLSVDLEDMSWPADLADLSFSLVTSGSVIGQFTGAGQQTFDITRGETLYAYVTGEATNPSNGLAYGVGLYTLSVSFTPVPLPLSVDLLLVGLLSLGLLHLRHRSNFQFPSAPPQGA